MKKTFLFVSILSALSCTTMANELPASEDEFLDFYGDEDFVSIATGTKTSLHKAPAVATLITADDIERLGASYLDEVLEKVPGLHVSFSTLSRLDPVYSIRGLQTGFNPQVLVLINGTEFKNSFSGGLPYTFRYPTTNIDRIEILRGPGTAVYGADAYSGVINIVTKKLQDSETMSLGARFGSFDSRDAWLQLGTNINQLKLGLSIESQQSDGDPDRLVSSDIQSAFDNALSTQASLAPSFLRTHYDILNIHATLEYGNIQWEHWYWQQDEGGLGPGGAQAIDDIGYQDFEEYRTKVSHRWQVSDNLEMVSDISYLDAKSSSYFVLFPAGAKLPIGPDGNLNFSDVAGIFDFPDGYIGNPQSDHEDIRVNNIINYTGLNDHALRFALGWFKQELTPSESKNFGPGIIDSSEAIVDGQLTDITNTPYIYITDVSRTNRHVSLQDIWKITNDWELTLGVRYDDFSDFGSTTNPRFALVWETAHNITTKLLYGSAFRAPSFNELFLKNNPSGIGNPDLKPEEIDTTELAINYQIDFDTSAAINFYHYEAKDLIGRAPVPGTTTRQSTNLNRLKGKGVEVEFNWNTNDQFRIEANLAYQQTKDVLTDKQIPLVPKLTAYLGASYEMSSNWQLNLSSHWIANRARAETDQREKLANYAVVNLSSRFLIPESNIKLIASAKNLFDRQGKEPSTGTIADDYPIQGRSLWLQIEYQLEN